MTKKVKILLLEDSPNDVELIWRMLQKEKINFEGLSVETKEEFISALKSFSPDIILSDHTLPSFNSHEALDILREKRLRLPFILITSTISGDFALDVIRRGADDYVLKDRMERLPSAVRNALEKYKLDRERQVYLDEIIKNEKHYRALIENINDAIILINKNGKVIYRSPSVDQITGLTVTELGTKKAFDNIHPDDLKDSLALFKEAGTQPGIPLSSQYRILHKNGYYIWVEGTIRNLLHDESVKAYILNFRDISERKQSEQKIFQANRLYAFISQINQTIVHVKDEQTLFREACRIAVEMGNFKMAWIGILDQPAREISLVAGHGTTKKDVTRLTKHKYEPDGPIEKILKGEDLSVANEIRLHGDVEINKYILERGFNASISLALRKSNRVTAIFTVYSSEINFFSEDEISLLKESAADISFALDVFEKDKLRGQAEQNLKFNELQLSLIYNNVTDSIFLLNVEKDNIYKFVSVNKAFLTSTGIREEDVLGKYVHEFIPAQSLKIVQDNYREAIKAKNKITWEETTTYPSGIKTGIVSVMPVFDSHGHCTQLIGSVKDITEKHEAEAILQRSQSNLQAIFENTSEGFVLTDTKGIVTAFNNKTKDIILKNVEKEIKIGDSLFEFIHVSRKVNYDDVISKVLKGETLQYDNPFTRKDGEIKWFNFNINPVYNAGKVEGLCITSADITERKNAEEYFRVSQSNLKAIIENTDAAIYSLDKNLRYIAFNQLLKNSMKELYNLEIHPGYHVFNFLGKLDPEEAASWKRIYSKALKGETVKFEKEFHFNHVFSCVSFSVHPIWENQEVIGLSCFTLDITKQSQTANALRKSEFQYRQIVETAQEGIWLIDAQNKTTFVNKKMCEILEYTSDEMLGKENAFFMDDAGKEAALETIARRKQGIAENIELRYLTKSGKYIWTNISANPLLDRNGKYEGALGMVTNITEKKVLEDLLDKTNRLAGIGSWVVDITGGTVFWSDIIKEILEVDHEYVPELASAIEFYLEGESRNRITERIQEAMEKGTHWDDELQITSLKGKVKWARVMGEAEFIQGKCTRLYGSFQDIDERKRAEIEVLKAYDEKDIILESFGDAFFAVDKNWIVTYWNKDAEKLFSIPKNNIIGRCLWDIFSNNRDSVSYKNYHLAIESNETVHFEDYYPFLNKWYEISAYPSANGLSVYFKDVTERKLAEIHLNESNENLQKKAKELAVSNAELEQFAYVASHDLQEPLRMITSFLTQLEKKYGDVIEDKGKQYIHFAVDGAKRMRQIILDLLEFSRVGRTDDKLEQVDLNELVSDILTLHGKQIKDKKVIVQVGQLPSLHTLKAPLRQVFQNLISNSLKYHKEMEGVIPSIAVEYQDSNINWLFSVTDNGLGIDPQYFEKIFIIFQRLHNKEEYSGTGIGLAVTKKIVENMGGKIWVESVEGSGSTFYFTLPKQN
jgi:PAS domain S-box-containing protein